MTEKQSPTMMMTPDQLRGLVDEQPIGYVTANGLRMLIQDEATVMLYRHDYLIRPDHIPLYTHPAPAVPAIEERGPWSAGQDKQQPWEQQVWIESDDFTHDVRLYVNGNFESGDQRFAYAQEIARRLNAAPAAPQAEPKREPLSDERIELPDYLRLRIACTAAAHDVHVYAIPLYSHPAPSTPHYAMLDSHRRQVEQAIQSAEHPSGMSTHDGKAHIDASILRRMLAIIDSHHHLIEQEKANGNR